MTRSPTFSLHIGWQTLLKDLGLRPAQVLHRAGLAEDRLQHTEQGMPAEEYFRFWRALEVETGDLLFPLRIVETISTELFDTALFAALCSANLMQASQRLARYKQLVAPMRLDIAVARNGDLSLSPRWLQAHDSVPASLEIAEIAFFVKLANLATREPVKAVAVTLPELPPQHRRRYQDFFGVPARAGAQSSITFAANDALRPFLTVSEGMWRAFEPDLRRRLNQLDAAATTADRVRALLLELLPANAATMEAVAGRLALSKRTLQRRLGDEGENFRMLVNATREQLARHYLNNTSMPAGEIAFLLGFADPNSFYRAFQDWTGQTPDTARQSMRLSPSASRLA